MVLGSMVSKAAYRDKARFPRGVTKDSQMRRREKEREAETKEAEIRIVRSGGKEGEAE